MYVLMISRSSSKLGHLGSKLGHQAKSKENLVNTLAITFLKQSSWILLKCFSWWFLGQVQNWVTWGQQLGHQAKSKEDLFNTLEVTFLKQSSWILLKMFILMISRWSLELGYLRPILQSSDFLKFFHFGPFLSNYWFIRVIFGTCEVFCVWVSLSVTVASTATAHAFILAWLC